VNEQFFFAHDWGGEPFVGHVRRNGVRAITEQQFCSMLRNRYVETRQPGDGGSGIVKRTELGKFWLAHPQRREYDRVVYDPEGTRSNPEERVFNLWTGFVRAPQPSHWHLMARHIFEVVCKRDREVWRYFIRWLAHAAQHPGTAPGTVPVLRSEA